MATEMSEEKGSKVTAVLLTKASLLAANDFNF